MHDPLTTPDRPVERILQGTTGVPDRPGMKRKPIPFDQLLSTILPVDRLALIDQADIRAALAEGDPTRIEKLALEVIRKLAQLGHLRALEETREGVSR